jgi:hypothetical protein
MCTPGTRVSVLNDTLSWAGTSEGPSVFWLNGLAATGKTTIARTLCKRLYEHGVLGGSFFISRNRPDRHDVSNIVHSLAHQLAVRHRPISDALCTKLRETPISAPRSLQQEIADLIITPFREVKDGNSFVLVIDALDECLSDFLGRPGGEFLLLLVRQLLQLDGRLRLFLTSRSEISIQHMFQELSAAAQMVVKLHDLDALVVRDDITAYLVHSFTAIRKALRELTLDDWPPTEDVNRLAELSGLLFIYAATAMRFVNDFRSSPRKRLAQLLAREQTATGTSPYGQLDGLYRQILNDAVRDSSGNDQIVLCQRLRAVMSVIVLAQTSLNMEALAILSGMDLDDTCIVVGSLSSLLTDSPSGVRIFHLSFPDFALDPIRCTDH